MIKNRPESRRTLAHDIALQLRRDIISGSFKPGQALAEAVLAGRFGVSRAPVREAMIELERSGLVQFGTTGRTRVRTLGEKGRGRNRRSPDRPGDDGGEAGSRPLDG